MVYAVSGVVLVMGAIIGYLAYTKLSANRGYSQKLEISEERDHA